MEQQTKRVFEKYEPALKDAQLREGITTGNCDFCYLPATQGRSLNTDVFLVCTSHKRKLNENTEVPTTLSITTADEFRKEQQDTKRTKIHQLDEGTEVLGWIGDCIITRRIPTSK